MALTSLSSIVSRCSSSKFDELNPADRAYIDECRRSNASMLQMSIAGQFTKNHNNNNNNDDRTNASSTGIFDASSSQFDHCRNSDPNSQHPQHPQHHHYHPKVSINPYHESFRAAQRQIFLAKQFSRTERASRGCGDNGSSNWNWKRTIALCAVLAGIVALIIAMACAFARDVRHRHYVTYFSLLIISIIGTCALIMIGGRVAPWIVDRYRYYRYSRTKNCTASADKSSSRSSSPGEQQHEQTSAPNDVAAMIV